MSDDPGLLVQIGVRLQDLIAGLMGGVVNAFVFSRSDPWSIIGSMVVGALTANYLSDPIGRMIGTSGGATAFIVGLAGMAICQGIVEAAKNWHPTSKGASDVTRPPT